MNTQTQNQAGFSLVELMIAMFILAFGIMATMAMQFSSLAGYRASRDMTGAVEMARSVEQNLRTEALQWVPDTPPTATAIYDEETSLLGALAGNTDWVAVSPTPLTANRGEGGAPRFCPYLRGEQLSGVDFLRVTIAVVYPSANGYFDGRAEATPDGTCPVFTSNDDLDPSNQEAIELQGLRVTFISTAIRPLGQTLL